jgi:hypothetical protein
MASTDPDWTTCVGPGWKPLVEPLIAQCQEEGTPILQVKEKFGGLRFYTGGGSAKLAAMIAAAETVSMRTCEECGKPGRTVAPQGWVRTLCYEHSVTVPPVKRIDIAKPGATVTLPLSTLEETLLVLDRARLFLNTRRVMPVSEIAAWDDLRARLNLHRVDAK